jgi:transglutaminase-like putative cysteine protease
VGFTSQWITNATTLVGLDATTVYQTRDASCTGYANLAVALGRAAGLPARHVVNIMVGEAQDMHSVTELYLGQALGWRRVEPQSTATTLAEDYGVIMRLVLPSDETAASLVTRDWAFGGVPLHELTEPVDGGARLEPKFQTHYDGCPNCSNRADPRGWLRDDAAQVASTFARARQTWQSDLAASVGGGIDPARMIARRAFLDARTLADVDHILGGL